MARREDLLQKRVERRQAETLIQESEAQGTIEAERCSQQALDNWYGSRQYRDGTDAAPPPTAVEGFGSRSSAASPTSSWQDEQITDET